MKNFKEKYNPKISEKKILEFWQKKNIYKFDKNTNKKIFSVDTPPPTISGKMHVGHAFSYTQQDFIVRFMKMSNFETYYPFGTDDNGLPTEKLIQKDLGVDLRKLKRKEAIKIALNYVKKERKNFIQDWQNLGISCDFDLCYSTISLYSQKISQKSFLELAKKNLIYRKKCPIPWDRVFQTTISQSELEDKIVKSKMNYIKTEIIGSENDFMIFGTTRPEMIFACHGFSVDEKGNYLKIKVGFENWILGSETYKKVLEGIEVEKIFIVKNSPPKKNFDTIKREGATAIIENVEGNKILIQKYPYTICFVGGGSEKGETKEECIRREIIEETGYTNFKIEKKIISNFRSFGYKENKNVNQDFLDDVFYVKLKGYKKIKCEEDEGDFKLEWVDKKKILEVVTTYHHILFYKKFLDSDFQIEKNNLQIVEKIKGKSLVKKKVLIPLINREIIITNDKSIKADLGTGAAYFCSFGGVEDIEYCRRNDVKIYEILNKDGTLNNLCKGFEGLMASKEGRFAVIKKLKEIKVLVKQENIEHIVNVGERSGVEVEFLSTTQWFLKLLDNKKLFLNQVKKLNFKPKYHISKLNNWINGLKWDYGFSRQRHFGIPIPVWYGKKTGKIYYANESQLPCDPTNSKPKNFKNHCVVDKNSTSTPLLSPTFTICSIFSCFTKTLISFNFLITANLPSLLAISPSNPLHKLFSVPSLFKIS